MPDNPGAVKHEGMARESADPINDNATPPPNSIPLSDLAKMMGADEDELLQRLAAILSEREDRE